MRSAPCRIPLTEAASLIGEEVFWFNPNYENTTLIGTGVFMGFWAGHNKVTPVPPTAELAYPFMVMVDDYLIYATDIYPVAQEVMA
jgi:hypothetical protein